MTLNARRTATEMAEDALDTANRKFERAEARVLLIATRAFEATRRVLQEASGLPDDIDDPDCRDEMVLALRPRAEKAEAEVARLRAGIEALAAEMSPACCMLRALLADTDSALAEGGDRG